MRVCSYAGKLTYTVNNGTNENAFKYFRRYQFHLEINPVKSKVIVEFSVGLYLVFFNLTISTLSLIKN